MDSVEIAKQKLQESDWSVLSDVDTRLVNKQDFINYRSALRNIVIQNVILSQLPEEPVAIWADTTV